MVGAAAGVIRHRHKEWFTINLAVGDGVPLECRRTGTHRPIDAVRRSHDLVAVAAISGHRYKERFAIDCAVGDRTPIVVNRAGSYCPVDTVW